MNIPRRPLNDGDLPDDILNAYDAAGDSEPVPAGTYRALAVAGCHRQSANGKWYYRVTWEIADGEHAGRRVSRMFYLTQDALEYTRKALGGLGLSSSAKLKEPFPAYRFVCDVDVKIRDFNGEPVNEVKSFTVVEEVEPKPDPFAPKETEGGPSNG